MMLRIIAGLTLDSDPPNYAQGVLTKLESATSANGSTTSVATAIFDDAFLTPNTSFLCTKSGQRGSKIMFWDPATRQVCCAPGWGEGRGF